MLGQRSDIARLQSDFYRDQYRKMLRWLSYSIATCFLLIFTIVYLILVQPPQYHYANTIEGKILPMPEAIDS